MLSSHTLSLSGSYPEVWGGTENPRGDEGGPARPLGGKARSEGNAWQVLSDPRGTGSHRTGLRRKVRDEFQCPKDSGCTPVFQCLVFVRTSSPHEGPGWEPRPRAPTRASGLEPRQRS